MIMEMDEMLNSPAYEAVMTAAQSMSSTSQSGGQWKRRMNEMFHALKSAQDEG